MNLSYNFDYLTFVYGETIKFYISYNSWSQKLVIYLYRNNVLAYNKIYESLN